MVGVCLTFDNGPEPAVTPGVLDVLARRRVTATFFLVGAKLRDPAARACAERAKAEGHAIGNHTLTHGAPLGTRSAAEAVAEIAETDALLGALQGPDRLFRPNGGGGRLGPHLLNRAAADHLIAHRHTVLLWNAVPRDFADPEGWVATAHGMLRDVRGTVVLVLHDLPNGAMRQLDRFLGEAEQAGAVFGAAPPDDCVPLRRGVPAEGFAQYVSD
ncbi:polysaccharide deacetylase family protein [Roseomonas terrae]|jgi:peptidoglycan/xylan/chitin deacetylase (PgdA/CDA1 family)|uniref:Chitooligosaccharide deacetylase n=1 Tax=Neoroseomonas terrae TaxID=424799 RepID=A0ABS5EH74_9PROT|nr:polysaccharide deacetylase family protein [Neoroseomonas terrae]MBR0650356.1 polysaccharide deacetylase family protein [Neoroseomonas terrae]